MNDELEITNEFQNSNFQYWDFIQNFKFITRNYF